MKTIPLLFAACFALSPLSSAEHVVTLGDSLTFAYEAEFGFHVYVLFDRYYGDNFGSEVRNWIEILNDPVYRKDRFDIGARYEFDLGFPVLFGNDLLFRHEYNWALPGLKVDELRQLITRETSADEMVSKDPEFSLLLSFSSLDLDGDYNIDQLEDQIQNTASRLVLFIGGNDVRGVYGGIYDGGSPGTFVADFVDDINAILDRVQTLNPNLPIVLVNVPHIGITPDIKADHPTDPVKTGYVTAVLRDLNGQLEQVAKDRNIGYADVFTPTLSLLNPDPLCIDGITFINSGSESGSLDYVWLNGEYSANFHPNTNGQAVVANVIIDAFNTRYHTGIAPLTATEKLGGLLGESAAQIDMPFATWMGGFGLSGLPGNDDSDGDGIPAAMEFALGLNPTLRDSYHVTSGLVNYGDGLKLELAYPVRLPVSNYYTLLPEYTANLTAGFSPFQSMPAAGPDGLVRAWFPVNGGPGFLRLKSNVGP